MLPVYSVRRHAVACLARAARPAGVYLTRTPVPNVAGDTKIRRVTVVPLETGLPGLRVVDKRSTMTGFISHSDILRAVAAAHPLEM